MWCLDNTLTWHLEGRANKNYIHIQAQTITYLITSYTKNVSCVENISTNAFIQYNLKHIMTWTSLHHWYIKIPFSRKQYLRVCLNIRLLFTQLAAVYSVQAVCEVVLQISRKESQGANTILCHRCHQEEISWSAPWLCWFSRSYYRLVWNLDIWRLTASDLTGISKPALRFGGTSNGSKSSESRSTSWQRCTTVSIKVLT